MKTKLQIVVSMLAVLWLSVAPTAATAAHSGGLQVALGDGSVRFLSAGPISLGAGWSAQTRLLLPAVEKADAQVFFLGGGGKVLAQVDVQPPARTSDPFFDVVFTIRFQDGTLSITDGTSNTVFFSEKSPGIIAILIGLRQATPGSAPRGHLASLQLFDSAGLTVQILPYIEHDNLYSFKIR